MEYYSVAVEREVPEIKQLTEFIDDIYNSKFADCFSEMQVLFKRFQNPEYKITNDELSKILIELPLNLFTICEDLNDLKMTANVIKIKLKNSKKTDDTIDMQMLQCAYSSLIDRVDNQVSMSKELIMSAKKIWDARTKGANVMPVAPPTTDNLPNYR